MLEATRGVDLEWELPAAEREGLEHPRQPEDVVGVEVREEDLPQLHEPDRRAEQLPLGAFRAVEEEPLAAAPDEESRRRTLGGRHRAGRAEEDEVEIHGPILGFGPSRQAALQPIADPRTNVFARGNRGFK